ncbi:S41 family peptidase [Marinobacterium rhizophilum]|uniref:S41 family peptidase n=2 Tax=Marinobacterium rhizophilum TaxID=420402 RepID=A0ABY5HPP6_9GAMM|nr:S41 family peptidase [Marinobacterium rhizophilum]
MFGALLLSVFLAVPVFADDSSELADDASELGSEDMLAEAATLPLEELRLFAEVFERIKTAYVEPVDDAELLEDAIRGMISGLDPHSAYLEPDAYQDLQEYTSGEFGGLGLEVGLQDGFIRVIAPIDDTPAQRGGVKAGDLIVKLDDTPVQGLSLNEAVALMRGKPNEPIVLTIVREGIEKPFEIKLLRDRIKVASVKHRVLESGYGYLRVSQFQVNTGTELAKAIGSLQNSGPLRGLVLDLRNNPGGVLQAAVEVSDAFIDEGLIVYTEGRLANSELRFNASAATVAPKVPMVVLINAGSASASEIVAGALQDHKRGLVLGTDSFGKGSVQTILPLTAERAVKLTTARYFTPSGRSIQAQGIVPDIRVEEAEVRNLDNGGRVKESDLSGHLENGTGAARTATGANAKLVEQDFQLFEALNLLKALVILQPPLKQG